MSSKLTEVADALLLLFTQHTRHEPIPQRNQTVRQLRMITTQLLQDAAGHGISAMQELREAMGKELHDMSRIGRARCGSPAEEEHLAYCLREIQLAFEMAEQIIAEYPTEPEIAKILIHDLPIFRPFDYGMVQG